ncbi:MAG: ABC transporter permease [Gemmatimonadota bacterium]|nr:MAG: ABC transporter permease [Gemmatimonadota bacterium]
MRPPRIAAWIIGCAIPSHELEWILGDLEEVYRARAAKSGSLVARLWYWGQAVVFSIRFLRERAREQRRERSRSRGAGRGQSESLGGVVKDVRFASRTLLHAPGFVLAGVTTLALGIGANTAIFSVVDSILLSPLPLVEPDHLVRICETNPAVAGFCIASPPNVADWSDQSRAFEAFGIARDWPFILKTDDGVEGISGGIATPGFFQALRFSPELGRLFAAADLDPGNNRVVLLTNATWRSRFGGDPAIIGRTLMLDDEIYTVIGVLPADAQVPQMEYFQLWTPLHFDPREERRRSWRGFRALGRLTEAATLDEARSEMSTIASRLASQFPETNEGWGVRLVPLHESVVGSARPMLLVFLGAVGLVLLIGCANIANLLLARSTGRRRELAVRAALGASRTRLVRLLLGESLLLALLGGAAGLLLAVWAVKAFVVLAPGGIPRLDEVAVDGRVLGFALLVSLAASVLFGLVPALRATSLNLNQELREGDRGAGKTDLGIRGLLVVSEVALALMLLVGAGLLTQSFARLLRWRPGFDRDNLLTVWLLASSGKYETGDQVQLQFRRATEAVAALGGVESVGTASAGPLFGGRETDEFRIESRSEGDPPVARWYDVGPGYFSTLGIPVVRGRGFTNADGRDAPPVAVINESAARRHWPGEDPLGQQVTIYGRTMRIVGVVADIRPLKAGTAIDSEIYWPQQQAPRYATFLVIRTRGDPANAVRSVRARIQQLDPDMQISGFNTMDQLMARQLVSPRFNMVLLAIFAAMALVLAAVGIYGVVAYTVARRTREMGIRLALGAQRWRVIGSVVAQGMLPVAAGVVLGLAGAMGLSRALATMIFGVSATDVPTFLGVAAALVSVATIACLVPAQRATKVDAVVALREE